MAKAKGPVRNNGTNTRSRPASEKAFQIQRRTRIGGYLLQGLTYRQMLVAEEQQSQGWRLQHGRAPERGMFAQSLLTVSTDVRICFEEWREENVDLIARVVEKQGRRLDLMLAGIWRRATSGETDAVNAVLSIEARRSKLLGLDAPTKVAQTDKGGNDIPPLSRYSDDELLLMAAFQAKAQGVEMTAQEQAALERWQGAAQAGSG